MAFDTPDLLHAAREALAALEPGGDEPPADQAMTAFLACLYDIALVYGTGPEALSALDAFIGESAHDVIKLVVPLSFYPGDLLAAFEGIWEDDEWVQLCRRRSALEFFMAFYANSDAWSVVNAVRGATVELDAYVRERGMIEGCLSDDEIDPAIPRSHWWWWLPGQG